MKISELNDEYVADYLRLDEPDEIMLQEVHAALTSAIAYAVHYTGLTEEEMEKYEDITMAILVLTAEMFENRNLYIDYKTKEVNKTVETILGMHQVNLL